MVDSRNVRFRGSSPPRPQPPTQPSRGESFAQQFLDADRRRVDDIVKYGGPFSGLGSRSADIAVSRGVSDSPGLRAGALAGDILLDPANLIGLPAATGGARTAGRVAQLAPDTRQLYLNSLLGRLYHGAKQTPPAVLSNRGPQPQNWFQGDTFLTTSKPLARTYASEGLYRARVPLDVAENTNILNLYNNPDEHLRLANSAGVLDYLSELGTNAVRHQSGHGMGAGTAGFSRMSLNPFTGRATSVPREAIEKPVYAFLEPAGIQMSRMTDRLGSLEKNFNNAAYRARFNIGDFFDRIRKTGAYDPDNIL